MAMTSPTVDAPGKPAKDPDLRATARERAKEYRDLSANARRAARMHQKIFLGTGILAIFLSAAAGLTLLARLSTELPTMLAFGATLISTIQTFVNNQKLADMHWKHRAGFERLAQNAETLANAAEPPTKGDMDELAKRWEEVDSSK